jgi:hypothetical protein
MRTVSYAALWCVSALPLFGPTLSAQTFRPRAALGIAAGFSQFDVDGTGTSRLIALRGEVETQPWLVLDGGVTVFRPRTQFEDDRHYFMPELQIQAQVPGRAVRPYVGFGIGTLLARRGPTAKRVVGGAGGLRIGFRESRVVLRTEIRIRGIGESFARGTITEWTIGAGYRFSPFPASAVAQKRDR